ncbi:hypothetical protein [Paraliomyxa miuraensis]|uniref:hypothetical protein n=1 Tax=Paraliomyxa miuraensis TaxID=376150 RepID=UPI00225B76D7|nr:hypothetical protein [Paraliomyxa miuraensis]MCX4243075.1 hypothetical protein [Paraliomyxa miuraensis]
MLNDRLPAAWSLFPLLGIVSCGDPTPSDQEFESLSGSATDGGGEGTGNQPDEGVDETGAGPTPVDDYCLFDPQADRHGYRYQCGGLVSVDVVVEHAFEGSPETAFLDFDFGPIADGDSYSDPLVMACCPLWDPSSPNCAQPHERACWIDVIEQGCSSMVDEIEMFAHDTFPGVLNTAKRNAVLKVAEYVAENQGACIAAFRDDTDIASTLQECDADDNGSFDFGDMLETGMWTFDPPGAVQNVEISVHSAWISKIYPIGADEPAPMTCSSADENDATRFVEVDPPPEAVVLGLASGGASLVGPAADGFSALDTTSTLAITSGALENLALHSGGTTIVAHGMTIPVDGLHLQLRERAPAVAEGATLTIAPGAARFGAGVSALGESRHRWVTNATPIVVTHDADGWASSGFEIKETVDGEPWTIAIAPARWHGEG